MRVYAQHIVLANVLQCCSGVAAIPNVFNDVTPQHVQHGIKVKVAKYKFSTMNVEVKFGRVYRSCNIVGAGFCKKCGSAIRWAVTPNDRYIPLNLGEEPDGSMAPHFGRACIPWSRSRSTPSPGPEPGGIEMSVTTWKQLLSLIHPDRHHGGENERLATSLTQGLLEQRPRLSKN